MASARRPSRQAPSTRSAAPYIGEESNSVEPAASAASTTFRAAARSSVSSVSDVPIPTTGTDGADPIRGDSDRFHAAPVSRAPAVITGAVDATGRHDVPGEHDVVARGNDHPVLESDAVGHALDAEAVDRLGPGAHDHRRDGDDEAIHDPGGEQRGDDGRAALDQDRLRARGPQRRQRARKVDAAVALGDDLHPDPSLAEQGPPGCDPIARW